MKKQAETRICAECAHYNPGEFSPACKKVRAVDFITGERSQAYCQNARQKGWQCGPSGKLFEKKPEPVKFCVNCRFHSVDDFCQRDELKYIDKVSGQVKYFSRYCGNERGHNDDSRCGPDAKFYKANPPEEPKGRMVQEAGWASMLGWFKRIYGEYK